MHYNSILTAAVLLTFAPTIYGMDQKKQERRAWKLYAVGEPKDLTAPTQGPSSDPYAIPAGVPKTFAKQKETNPTTWRWLRRFTWPLTRAMTISLHSPEAQKHLADLANRATRPLSDDPPAPADDDKKKSDHYISCTDVWRQSTDPYPLPDE